MSTLRTMLASEQTDAVRIGPLKPADAAACAELLERCLAAAPAGRVRSANAAEIRSLLDRADSRSAGIRTAGALTGVAIWSHLAWDTRHLGHRSARISHLAADGGRAIAARRKRALLSCLLTRCAEEDVDYVVARVPAFDITSIHTLEAAGFQVVDAILTFTLAADAAATVEPSSGIHVRHATDEDNKPVEQIARKAFTHDRFHLDPHIPHRVADEIYAAWAANACRLIAADAVLIATDGERVLGFVTCSIGSGHTGLRVGTIGLVATDAASRGQGVAGALTHAAVQWFRSQQVPVVEVGTQLANIAAARLYERCGFRVAASYLTLRKWLRA